MALLPIHRLVEHFKIHLQAQLRGFQEALEIVADVEPAHRQAAVLRAAHHRLHIDDRQAPQEFVAGAVEHVAHRIHGAAHNPLHAVHRAQVVAAIDALAPARADEDVLRVVGHADHFVRHHLADRQNQIEAAPRDELVHLRRPGVVQLALGLLLNERGRQLAQCLDFGAPVVCAEQIPRHVAEHMRNLVGPHGRMRAKGRQDRLQLVSIVLPRESRQVTGARVLAALVGRYSQHVAARTQLGQALHQQLIELRGGKIGVNTTNGTIETHPTNSLSLSSNHRTKQILAMGNGQELKTNH